MAVTEVDFDVRRLLDFLEESEPGVTAEFVAGGFFVTSTRKLDETTKRDTYRRYGVECWTIDPVDIEAGFSASGRFGDIPFPGVTS